MKNTKKIDNGTRKYHWLIRSKSRWRIACNFGGWWIESILGILRLKCLNPKLTKLKSRWWRIVGDECHLCFCHLNWRQQEFTSWIAYEIRKSTYGLSWYFHILTWGVNENKNSVKKWRLFTYELTRIKHNQIRTWQSIFKARCILIKKWTKRTWSTAILGLKWRHRPTH